jgi:hypothetical protein
VRAASAGLKEALMVFVYVLVAILGAAAMAFAVQNPDPVAVRPSSAREP